MYRIVNTLDKDSVIKSVYISPCSNFFAYVIENVEEGEYKDIVKIYSKDMEKLYEKKFDTVIDDVAISYNGEKFFILTRYELIVLDKNFKQLFKKELDEKRVLHFIYITRDARYYSIATYNPGIVRYYKNGNLLFEKRTRNRITGYFMNLEGNTLIAADEDSFLYVYDNEGNLILEKNVEKSGIYKVSIVNDKILYTISGEEFSLNIIEKSGKPVKKYELEKQPLCIYSTKRTFVGAEDSIIILDENLNIVQNINLETYVNDICCDENSNIAIIGTDSGAYIISI